MCPPSSATWPSRRSGTTRRQCSHRRRSSPNRDGRRCAGSSTSGPGERGKLRNIAVTRAAVRFARTRRSPQIRSSLRGGRVSVTVQIQPVQETPPEVEYRWDADTDILTANVRANAVGEGISGSIDLIGTDGAWLNLDVSGGRLHG